MSFGGSSSSSTGSSIQWRRPDSSGQPDHRISNGIPAEVRNWLTQPAVRSLSLRWCAWNHRCHTLGIDVEGQKCRRFTFRVAPQINEPSPLASANAAAVCLRPLTSQRRENIFLCDLQLHESVDVFQCGIGTIFVADREILFVICLAQLSR
jgi:hypothetical protein